MVTVSTNCIILITDHLLTQLRVLLYHHCHPVRCDSGAKRNLKTCNETENYFIQKVTIRVIAPFVRNMLRVVSIRTAVLMDLAML